MLPYYPTFPLGRKSCAEQWADRGVARVPFRRPSHRTGTSNQADGEHRSDCFEHLGYRDNSHPLLEQELPPCPRRHIEPTGSTGNRRTSTSSARTVRERPRGKEDRCCSLHSVNAATHSCTTRKRYTGKQIPAAADGNRVTTRSRLAYVPARHVPLLTVTALPLDTSSARRARQHAHDSSKRSFADIAGPLRQLGAGMPPERTRKRSNWCSHAKVRSTTHRASPKPEQPAGTPPRDGRDVGDRLERIRIGRFEHRSSAQTI